VRELHRERTQHWNQWSLRLVGNRQWTVHHCSFLRVALQLGSRFRQVRLERLEPISIRSNVARIRSQNGIHRSLGAAENRDATAVQTPSAPLRIALLV